MSAKRTLPRDLSNQALYLDWMRSREASPSREEAVKLTPFVPRRSRNGKKAREFEKINLRQSGSLI